MVRIWRYPQSATPGPLKSNGLSTVPFPTAGLGGEEGVEQPFRFVRVNPKVGVPHRHGHLAGFVLLQSNEDLTAIRDWRHRVNAVYHQADKHSLQLDPIEPSTKGNADACPVPQRHPMAEHLTLHQENSLADDLVDVRRHHQRPGLFGQCTNPPQDFAPPIAVPDDALHGGSHLVQARVSTARAYGSGSQPKHRGVPQGESVWNAVRAFPPSRNKS